MAIQSYLKLNWIVHSYTFFILNIACIMHISLILSLYPGETTHIDAHFQNWQLNKRTHPQRTTPPQGPALPGEQQRSGFEQKTSFLCSDSTLPLQMLSSPSFIKLLARPSGNILPLNSQWAACLFFSLPTFQVVVVCEMVTLSVSVHQTSKVPSKPFQVFCFYKAWNTTRT